MNLAVKTSNGSFGRVCELETPSDCDLIIVLVNNGGGWQGREVLLPHQLYARMVQHHLDALTGYPAYCEVAYVPVRSRDIRVVANKAAQRGASKTATR